MPASKHELGDLAQSLEGHYAKIYWMREHIPAQMLLSEEFQGILEKELDLIVKMQQAAEKAEQIGGSKTWNKIEAAMGKKNMDPVLQEVKKLDSVGLEGQKREVVKNVKKKPSKSIFGRIIDVITWLITLCFIVVVVVAYASTTLPEDQVKKDEAWKELVESMKSRG